MLPALRQIPLQSENSVDSGELVHLPAWLDSSISCDEVIPAADDEIAIYNVSHLSEQQNRVAGPLPAPGEPMVAVMSARSPPAASSPTFLGSKLPVHTNGVVCHVHDVPGVMIPHSASSSPELTQAQWQTGNMAAATPDIISSIYGSSGRLGMLAAPPAEPCPSSPQTPTGAAFAASLHVLRAPTPAGYGTITTEQTLRGNSGLTNAQQRGILDNLAQPQQEPHQAPVQILPLQHLQQPSPLQYQQQYSPFQQHSLASFHQQQGLCYQLPVPWSNGTGRATRNCAARPSVQPEPKQRAPNPVVVKCKHQSLLPVTPPKGNNKSNEPQKQPQQLQEADNTEEDGTPERKRRGRPPNKPGEYSRGYLAIKAYRQRNKEKTHQDELKIASLKEDVERLQAEQQRLLLKRDALELIAAASDNVMAQLAGIQLAVGADPSTTGVRSSAGGIGVPSEVIAQMLDNVLAASGGYSAACDVDWGYTIAFTESQVQLVTRQSTDALLRLQYDAGAETAGKYKAYVEGATARMSHVNCLPAAAAASGAGFCAPFPLDVADMVRLWQLYRTAPSATGESAGAYGIKHASPANSSNGISSDLMSLDGFGLLDLEVGAVVQVGHKYWDIVAGSVQLHSEAQKQLLEVLCNHHSAALQKLQRDRQQLLRQYQASGEQLDSCVGMAAAVECFMVRALAAVLTFDQAMLSALSAEQISRVCVASWPHVPMVSTVVAHLVGKPEVHASHEGHASSAAMDMA